MSSLEYLEFAQKQLAFETVEQIIVLGLLNLRLLFTNYLPLSLVCHRKDAIFATLLNMLVNEKVTKEPIVDQLFYFLSPCSEGNMSMAYKWFKQS